MTSISMLIKCTDHDKQSVLEQSNSIFCTYWFIQLYKALPNHSLLVLRGGFNRPEQTRIKYYDYTYYESLPIII